MQGATARSLYKIDDLAKEDRKTNLQRVKDKKVPFVTTYHPVVMSLNTVLHVKKSLSILYSNDQMADWKRIKWQLLGAKKP